MSVETIDCTALGCDAELKPVSFDPCNTKIAYNAIGMLYIANVGNPLVNWTDPAEWASRISDDSTDADAIRAIPVLGTLEVEEGDQVPVPGNKFVYGKKTLTITGQVYDNNNVNYEWVRSMGCNKQYAVWFRSEDGQHLYGGNAGIETVVQGSEAFAEDRTTIRTFAITMTWQAQLIPLRIANPLPIAA